MGTELVLGVHGVRAGYSGTPVLRGLDLSVSKGSITGLIGRNGVGKTTAMRCLVGQLKVSSGSIRFMNDDVTAAESDERSRRGMSFVPQGREVFPRLSVSENLMVGALGAGRAWKSSTMDLVFQYFPRLAERRTQLAGTMSGGEQQQLAIGCAIVSNPALLLLDEPSEGIQPSIVDLICDVLKAVRSDMGTTILFVEQNLDVILGLADSALVMDKGQIVAGIPSGGITAAGT